MNPPAIRRAGLLVLKLPLSEDSSSLSGLLLGDGTVVTALRDENQEGDQQHPGDVANDLVVLHRGGGLLHGRNWFSFSPSG